MKQRESAYIPAVQQPLILCRKFFYGDHGRHSRYLEACLDHQKITLSKFHRLIHKIYPTNHHSSQEHAFYGTYCYLLPSLSSKTFPFSNLRSINLIRPPSPLSLLLSSIVGDLHSPPWYFPQHNSLKSQF